MLSVQRLGRLLVPVALVVLSIGCSRSPVTIPEHPPDAIQSVVEGLSGNRPEVLWNVLPPSYQRDIREVIATFCTHMDADLYDRGFRILAKAVQVLKEKKAYLYKNPIALSTPILESSMGSQWNATVGLLDAIARSELSTLEGLRQMDPGQFLASTGRRVMGNLDELRIRSQRSPTPGPWDRLSQVLRETRIDFHEAGDGRGTLRFDPATTDGVSEVELTRVEGRWVPAEVASAWQEHVEQAKERITALSGAEFLQARPVLSLVLNTLEGAMDALLRARSQKEFDDTFGRLAAIGGLLQSLSGVR